MVFSQPKKLFDELGISELSKCFPQPIVLLRNFSVADTLPVRLYSIWYNAIERKIKKLSKRINGGQHVSINQKYCAKSH